MVAGMTTIKAPARMLRRKLVREGVMGFCPDNDFDEMLLNIIDQLNTVNTTARLGFSLKRANS
jgi:hypothetical protein